MRKYDIALLLLYAFIITTSYSVCRYIFYKKIETRKIYSEIVNNKNITKIVINNVMSPLKIVYLKESDLLTWELNAHLNQFDFNSFYIKDGVLHIENIKRQVLSALLIHPDVLLEIKNSPNVEIVSAEESDKKVTK